MLKILLRKTISSLMLMTLAMFLVSFNNNNLENIERNNFETQQNILNTESANVTVSAVNGINASIYNWSGETVGSLRSTTTLSNFAYGPNSNNILNSNTNVQFYAKFTGYIVPTHNNMWFRALADDGVRIRFGPNPSSTTLFYNDWVYQGVDENYQAQYATQANIPLYFELEFMQGGGPWGLDLRWSPTNSSYTTIPSSAFFLSHPTATMSFNSNGGTAVSSIIAQRNLSFTLPSNPTRTGYSFTQWNYSTGNVVNISTFPLTNTTVNAVWSANQYAVTLDQNNGLSGTSSVNATYDSNMPAAIAPTRVGYNFQGYFDTNAQIGGTQYYDSNMASLRTWNIASISTLYARWNPVSYNVTLNKNNGTGGSSSVSATYDAAMPDITVPTRTGLTFLGYFDSLNGGTQYYNSNGISYRTWNYAESRTLFARWGITGNVIFSATGNTTWNVPAGVTSINYLVVGGGGGGGFGYDDGAGGGGGAGGFLTGILETVPNSLLDIKVGAGGVGGSGNLSLLGQDITFGSRGEDSFLGSITAFGGGGGAASRRGLQGRDYLNGASGGGAGSRHFGTGVDVQAGYLGGTAISGQGNVGASKPLGNLNAANGGGGAGGEGFSSTNNTGGAGGIGISSNLSGQETVYSTGGRGGNASSNSVGLNATENTGNGGGGASSASAGYYSGGNGGSGIVIISYSIILSDYTINLDKQGGVGGTDSVSSSFNVEMPIALAPTRIGYTFEGYFDDISEGNQYYSSTMESLRNWDYSQDKTLYARWTQDEYIITFNKNLGIGGSTTMSATYNQQLSNDGIAPSRSGFIFGGYYTETNGAGTQFFDSEMTPKVNYTLTTDVTLFAKWTASVSLAKPTLNSDNSFDIFYFTDASSSYNLPIYSGNEIVMTTGTAQASAFFFNEKIILNNGFSTYFEIKQYRTSESTPADGLVFVLSGNTNSIGASGGGLGYLGLSNSIGVTFDNYKNTGEPNPVFTTVYTDGDTSELWNGTEVIQYDPSFLTDYSSSSINSLVRTYKVWLNYDLSNRNLHFKININNTISTYIFSGVDVPDEFYAGFTAATGGSSVKFAIPTWYFSNSYYSDGINPTSSTETFIEDRTAPSSPTILLEKISGNNSALLISGSIDNIAGTNISYQYSFDNIIWFDYSGSEIFDTTSNSTVYARAYDTAGNLSEASSISTRFTLFFEANGGTIIDSITEIPGASISRPNNPTREGYSFVDWFTENSNFNTEFNFSNGINQQTTIYAKWTGLTYSIIFDKQTGSGGDNNVEVTFGSPMESALLPTKFGYNFSGYFSESNGQGIQYYNATMASTRNWDIPSDVILYALWTPKSILVTLNNNPGSDGSSSVLATFDSPLPSAYKPVLDGHDFIGYFSQENGQGIKYYDENMESLSNWTSETNSTLYAYFNPSSYDIFFNENQGLNLSFNTKVVVYNQNFGELPTVERVGYDFAGWFDDSIGGNQITSTSEVLITDDKDYYARWIPKTFTITFDKSLGNEGTNSILASYETALPEIIAPIRSGYTFEGYSNAIGTLFYSEKLESLLEFNFLENITLYAEWSPNKYNLTFDPYGGLLTGFSSKQVTFDIAYGTLSVATKEGHTFLGWYTSQIAGFEVRSTDINTSFIDQTLYARWSVNQYSVEFNTNGGNNIEPILINYGSTISVPSAVKAGGYEFVSWYPSLPATMPASNLNLSAVYKRNVVDSNFSVSNIESNFKDGLIRFSLGIEDSNAFIFIDNEVNLASPGSSLNSGVISRNGSDLYYGTGSGLVRFGQIDPTHNGNNGSDLLVNINSTLLFANGDFSNDFTNWTVTNGNYSISGDSGRSMSYQNSIITSGGNKFARLQISGTTNSYGTAHGPSLKSEAFSAKPGDMISFKWKADANLDDYDVYAFLDNNGVLTELLYSRGGTQPNFQTREITLTNDMLPNGLTDNLRFIFVAGSYDRNGGTGVGATFYIDDVSIVDNGVTASVINNLIKNVKYSGIENNQFIDIRTEDASNVVNYYLINNESMQDQTEELDLELRTSYSFMQEEDFTLKLDFSRYFTNSNNITYTIVDPFNNLADFVYMDNNVLNGSGNNSKVGNNTVYVKATTEDYQSSIIAFNIAIININDAPIINPIYQSFRIPVPFNQTFVYFIPSDFMLDPDVGTILTYTVTGTLPLGISYKPETRSFSGSCNLCDLSNIITITASDGVLSVSDNNIGFTSSLTVLFETNGGSIIPSQTIESGQAVVKPEIDPTRTGYSFSGWYLDPSLSIIYDFTTTPPYGSVYAKWTPNKYNVTFKHPNGEIISESLLDYDTAIVIPDDPTNLGQLFDGWSPNVNSTVPASDIIYTATFRNKEFGYLIHENHSLAIAPVLVIAEFGDDIESALEPPIRLGYTFKGWFADQEMTVRINAPKSMPDLGADGTIIDLYASWEPTKFAINYIGMLVPNTSNPSFYTIESEQIRFNTNLSNSSIIFLGFFDNQQFLGLPITRIQIGSTGEVNLYANFISPSYNLSFVDNSGNVLSSQLVKYGTTIDTSYFPSVEKEGYDFVGWSSNLPTIMPDSNVVVIATFKAKAYKLTVTDFNGVIIFSEMFEVDEPLTGIVLPIIEVEGFEFEAWDPQVPATMPIGDLQISSKYRELPKFKILIYGTQDEVIAEFEFKEKEEVKNVVLPDLTNSKDFIFEGWDTQIPSVMPANNIEIRPLGTKMEAILNLYSADKTLLSTIQAQIGSKLSIPIPSRQGYNFLGWVDENGRLKDITTMPEENTSLFATWQAKIYSILVTVGSNDFDLNVTFGEPIGNISSPQLFGFRFEGWKNNLTGEFLNSNTIFTSPEQINLVPVFTRLNAGETLIAATRLISDFIIRLFS